MAAADSAKNRGRRKGTQNLQCKVYLYVNFLLQTAEEDAYDFFTSAIDGDVLDHLPLPRRNLSTTNETRGQGVPPSAAGEELMAEREEERSRDEADTSALLEQQVSP